MKLELPEATQSIGWAVKAFDRARTELATFADALEKRKETATKEEMELWARVFRRVLPSVMEYSDAAESELYRVCYVIEECIGDDEDDSDVDDEMKDILARVRKLDDEEQD